jgi:glutamyl-tRNA(Gln) amidotransferase subunit D
MDETPAIGTRVKIEVSGPAGPTTHSGVVLPGASTDYITIKLVNGYNISHPFSGITSLEIIAEPADITSTKPKAIEQNNRLPKVTIIHTGGTIASKVDYATGAVVARFEPAEILAGMPELANIAYIESMKLGNMWSDDIRPQHWNAMVDAAQNAFDSGSVGVVITHGTDTMHISAAALAFAFAGNGTRAAGRIVFTGSQRSSDRGSSDATENLLSAVHWAANGPVSTGEGDTTVTVMHAGSGDGICAVNPGVGVRKLHSTRRDAFRTVNHEPLAMVHFSREGITDDSSATSPSREISGPTRYDTSIKIAQFIAGPHLHGDLIAAAESAGYAAAIIHGTGLGHLPIEDPMGDSPENIALFEIIKNCNMPIIIANQCIHGPVDMNVYSKGRIQQDIGVLGHGSTTSPEALLAKVHWLLSQGLDLKEMLGKNLCGENSQILNA